MKRSPTLFLRASILFITLVVAGLCLFAIPAAVIADGGGFIHPLIIGLYVSTIPFYIALYQGWKLLGLIDRQKAFSNRSVKSLTIIKYCGGMICGLYTLSLPYLYVLVQAEDAPGLLALGIFIAFVAFVVATLAALFQKLFQQAMRIQAENELTV